MLSLKVPDGSVDGYSQWAAVLLQVGNAQAGESDAFAFSDLFEEATPGGN
jgi:hypothetical protein